MNKDKTYIFVEAPVPKAVVTLAVPTVISMIVNIIYNMADTFFIGQTGDGNKVAAVSMAMPVFLLLMALGNVFGIGGSAFIARSLGVNDREKVKKISSFCFYASIAVGIIMAVVFIVGRPVILKIIGSTSLTDEFAAEYFTYVALGAPFVLLSVTFSNIVRGEGAAKEAMFGMLLGTIVNIILDPIMILTMNMGVAGAAIATVIGNVASAVYYIIYLCGKKTILSFKPSDFKIGDGILAGVFAIGVPAGLNNVLLSTANIVLNNFLKEYGENAVAAMGIASKINLAAVLLMIGVGTGIQPLVGYNYGAKNYKRMYAVMKFAMMCTCIIGLVVSAICIIFARPAVAMFIDDEKIIEKGIPMLRALMISPVFLGVMFIFTFSLQGMGKAIPSLILTLSRQGIAFFPALLILSPLFKLDGIIFAQPVADIFSTIVSVIIFIVIFKNLKKTSEKELLSTQG